jgi:hypothetical protein
MTARTIKELKGFSESEIYLMEENKKLFVRKLGKVKRNVEKMLSLSEQGFILPKVYDYSKNRLDNFNLIPGLIKVDVEGYESKVLEGAINTIEKHKPVLILEHSVKTIKKLMPILDHLHYICVYVHQKDKIWIHNENNTNRT